MGTKGINAEKLGINQEQKFLMQSLWHVVKLKEYEETKRDAEAQRVANRKSYWKYIEKSRARKRTASKVWAKRNPDKVQEKNRNWPKNNPEKDKARQHRRRTLKLGNGGTWTPQEWIDLKTTYGNRCLCCGRTEVELKVEHLHLVPDHVISVKMSETLMLPLGFLNSIENIQPLCHALIKGSKGGCNQSKRDKYIDYRKEITQWQVISVSTGG